MKILVSQMKPYLGDVDKNLKKITESIEEGIKEKCDIVVFPELALNGTLMEDIVFDTAISEIPQALFELSRKITIIFGAAGEENNRFFNCGYCLEDGKLLMKHKKIFLSNGNGESESKYFTRGKEIKTFRSRHGVFGIVLGEEGLNPMINGILGAQGAEVVFNLINESAAVKEEVSLYEASAVNNSVYNKYFTVTVNRTGVEDGTTFTGNSFAVSPFGKIIEKMEKFTEKLSIINVELKDVKRAYMASSFDKENNFEVIQKELERVIKRG